MRLLIEKLYAMGSESMTLKDIWSIHALVRPESRDCDLDPSFEIKWTKHIEMSIHSIRGDVHYTAHFKSSVLDAERSLELALSDEKNIIRIKKMSSWVRMIVENLDSHGEKVTTENPQELHDASKILSKFTLLFDTLPNILVSEKVFYGKVATAASPFRDLLIK